MRQGGKRNTIKMYHLTSKRRKERKMKKATRRHTSMNKRSLLSDTCHPAPDFPEEARQQTEGNDQKNSVFKNYLILSADFLIALSDFLIALPDSLIAFTNCLILPASFLIKATPTSPFKEYTIRKQQASTMRYFRLYINKLDFIAFSSP